MKGVSRIGLLILAALMLAGTVACNRADGSRRQGRAGETRWPGPEPQDLGGLVFKIADNTNFRFFPSENELGTPLGDAKLAVMESIQDNFNISFELIIVSENDILNRLSPAVWAGDMFAHMIITTKWAYGLLIGADIMGDLSAVPTLNLDSGLWIQPIHRATTVKNEVLATAGIFEHWGSTWAVYFQKGLWEELNLPDPYDMVRRGEWTWDRLLEFAIIAQQDLTGDGVVDNPNDRWGLVATPDDFLRAWYTSMGGLYFDFNPLTGRLFLPAATSDGIAIANWMRNFTQIPGVYPGASIQGDIRFEMFINRRALFSVSSLSVPGPLRSMTDDFGILPMPKRNVQQLTYLNNVNHNAMLIGITKTNDQLEATGIIMEAMAARFGIVRELHRAELEDILLRSDDDVRMLDYIIPYPIYDIGHIMNRASNAFRIPHSILTQYVTAHTITDFASEMEANRDAIEIEVNEMFTGER